MATDCKAKYYFHCFLLSTCQFLQWCLLSPVIVFSLGQDSSFLHCALPIPWSLFIFILSSQYRTCGYNYICNYIWKSITKNRLLYSSSPSLISRKIFWFVISCLLSSLIHKDNMDSSLSTLMPLNSFSLSWQMNVNLDDFFTPVSNFRMHSNSWTSRWVAILSYFFLLY